MTAITAESMTLTTTPVAEAFERMMLGFGDDWAGLGRLPAMVGVVYVWFVLSLVVRCAVGFCEHSGAGMELFGGPVSCGNHSVTE